MAKKNKSAVLWASGLGVTVEGGQEGCLLAPVPGRREMKLQRPSGLKDTAHVLTELTVPTSGTSVAVVMWWQVV